MKELIAKRPFVYLLIGGMYFSNALPAIAGASKKKDKNKPNIIYIYADDLGKGMISAYGQKIISTPNIDKLVNQGVSFNKSYAAAYSAPSRASFITGYSDCHKGHWEKTLGGPYAISDTALIAPIEAKLNAHDVRLAKGDDYLAEVFNKAGYYTAEIGKLDYGFLSSRKQIKEHGWKYFYGYMDHHRCHGFFPPFLFENDKITMIPGNERADCGDTGYEYDSEESYLHRWDMTGKKVYSQSLFDDKISEFLDAHYKKPFFLYHPSQLPHGSVSVPYIHDKVKNMPGLTTVEKEYATMVLMLDESVGKIIDKVKKLGIADNTIIIFSSDNGHEIFYEAKGHTSKDKDIRTGKKVDDYNVCFRSEIVGDIFNGNMGRAGKKRSNLEGGINVPLTFYCPTLLKPYKCNEIVANYDFISTMADMLHVPVSPNKQGKSYLKLLTDPDAKLASDKCVFFDSSEGPSLVRNDGWKVRYCNVTKKYQLFNVNDDPAEYNDLAEKYPELVNELAQKLEENSQVTICYSDYNRLDGKNVKEAKPKRIKKATAKKK